MERGLVIEEDDRLEGDDLDEVRALLHDEGNVREGPSDDDDDEEEEEEEEREPFDYVAYYRERFPERYGVVKENGGKSIENPVALVTVEDDYVKELLQNAFAKRKNWTVYPRKPQGEVEYHFHWGEYEDLDWFSPRFESEEIVVSCFYNRKGLIRKGHLAFVLNKWRAKYPDREPLCPDSYVLSFGVDQGLSETSLEQVLEETGFPGFGDSRDGIDIRDYTSDQGVVWILKPSFTNQAKGISLVRSKNQLLKAILDSDELAKAGDFVLQRYIEPLLVNGSKFHLRVFALVHGDISVYVFPDYLAIFSLEQYQDASLDETRAHLTNICHQKVQSLEDQHRCMRLFDEISPDLIRSGLVKDDAEAMVRMDEVKKRVQDSIGETLEAVSAELSFQARKNCFEIFGFDYLIGSDWNVWLLEANAEPDLKQAGDRLQAVIDRMLQDTLSIVVDENPRFGTSVDSLDRQDRKVKFVKVYERLKKF